MSRQLTKARYGSDGTVLAPRWAVSAALNRNRELVSRHCRPIACDAHSRALLYDVDEAQTVLQAVGRRRKTSDSSQKVQTSGTFLGGPVCPLPVEDFAELAQGLSKDQISRLIEHYHYLQDVGVEIDRETFSRMVEYELDQSARCEREARPTTVYYLRVGTLIKIGQTYDVSLRLKHYPPDTVLLATEQGERNVLETRRLQQFADARTRRREWFHPTAALICHINSLREAPLTVQELL